MGNTQPSETHHAPFTLTNLTPLSPPSTPSAVSVCSLGSITLMVTGLSGALSSGQDMFHFAAAPRKEKNPAVVILRLCSDSEEPKDSADWTACCDYKNNSEFAVLSHWWVFRAWCYLT